MSVVVFLGPSLDRKSAQEVLDATYLPPASQGDVYLAARDKPWGIGIIDGYFKHAPAVWHKEILWALSKGVHVFGAASMGALRAAELATFGMVGVGKIYDSFAVGNFENDDEVTILHSDAESGYQALSKALVNIRATLDKAVSEFVIDNHQKETLIRLIQNEFYEERTYDRLFELATTDTFDNQSLEALQQWLPENQVDQKRDDALLMLKVMDTQQRQHSKPITVSFRFQHTDAWEQVRRQIQHKSLKDHSAWATQQGDAILSELKLRAPEFVAARENALVHLLCQELALGTGETVDGKLIPDALEKFRIRQGLTRADSVEPWLEEQGMDVASLVRMLREELTTSRYRSLFDADLELALVEHLRFSGRYQSLQDRADNKQTLLSHRGLHNPNLSDAGLSEAALWTWYFIDYLDLDNEPNPTEYAHQLGFRDQASLRREVLREYLYQSLVETQT